MCGIIGYVGNDEKNFSRWQTFHFDPMPFAYIGIHPTFTSAPDVSLLPILPSTKLVSEEVHDPPLRMSSATLVNTSCFA